MDSLDQIAEMKALRRVIDAYLDYPRAAEEDVLRWERSYSRMNNSQKALLPHLPAKYAAIRRCIAANAQFINAMIQAFEAPFPMDDDEEPSKNHTMEKERSRFSMDQNSIQDTKSYDNSFAAVGGKRQDGEYGRKFPESFEKSNNLNPQVNVDSKGADDKKSFFDLQQQPKENKFSEFLPSGSRGSLAEEASLLEKNEPHESHDHSIVENSPSAAHVADMMDISESKVGADNMNTDAVSSAVTSDVHGDKPSAQCDSGKDDGSDGQKTSMDKEMVMEYDKEKSNGGEDRRKQVLDLASEASDQDTSMRESPCQHPNPISDRVETDPLARDGPSKRFISQGHSLSTPPDSSRGTFIDEPARNSISDSKPLFTEEVGKPRRKFTSQFDVGDHHARSSSVFSKRVSLADVDKVRCILRNIVRDWAEEGVEERKQCYGPILAELMRLFPYDSRTSRKPTCLVPGAGLGRLACEISRLGFVCQGNEFSYYMLICSNFLLNHSQSLYEWVFHPWIHNSCNVVSDSDQLRHVAFPDLLPWQAGITEGFSMCAGDFLEVYSTPSQTGAWDCVVTCFFIDTAHNIADYISVIASTLKPGGVWINMGPLLYHFAEAFSCSAHDEQSVELSLEDVKRVAKGFGFRMEREERVECTYTSNPRSMMRNQYTCAFWTMIKEETVADVRKQKQSMGGGITSDLRSPFISSPAIASCP